MQRYIVKRVLYACVSLAALTLVIFCVVRISGDPAILMAEPGAKEEDLQAIRQEFGLDQPYVVQYVVWVQNMLKGDFGKSIYYRIPTFELYLQRLPASMLLAATAMAISLIIGIPVGMVSAVRVNTWFDNFGKIFAILGLSLANFWVGLMLILALSVYLNWLPTSGADSWRHLFMPAFTLGWGFAAAQMRLSRSAMLEVLGSEYVKLARIKGLSERLVIAKHAFKNAVIPVLTLAGINLVVMVNAAVAVETVFAWPGIGRLVYEGVSFRDFPVVQTTVLMIGVMTVAVNLIVDILYAYIDPRIRYGN
jgi:peptide/nickel transport system permease protein